MLDCVFLGITVHQYLFVLRYLDKKMGLVSQNIDWKIRRDNMQDVCSACNSDGYIENFYTQYDGLIELYNDKFAKSGLALMKTAKTLMQPVKFSNKIDFIWFEWWHHEGRRARHGASMMGPDITHWHGTYEIARNFYTHLITELEHLIEIGFFASNWLEIIAHRLRQNKSPLQYFWLNKQKKT